MFCVNALESYQYFAVVCDLRWDSILKILDSGKLQNSALKRCIFVSKLHKVKKLKKKNNLQNKARHVLECAKAAAAPNLPKSAPGLLHIHTYARMALVRSQYVHDSG